MRSRFNTKVLAEPRWIIAALVGILLSVGFVRLGFWQLDRLEERRDLNAVIELRGAAAALPLDTAMALYGESSVEMIHRRASVKGVYRTSDEFFSIGRVFSGEQGTLVATPLDLESGRVLIVVRGYVPPVTEGPPAQGFEPPHGLVSLVGRIDDGEGETQIGESQPINGELISLSRLDLSYIDRWVAGDVLPFTLVLEQQVPPDQKGTPTRIPEVEYGEGSHLGYAIQWFAFALIVSLGVTALIYRAGERGVASDAPDSSGVLQDQEPQV